MTGAAASLPAAVTVADVGGTFAGRIWDPHLGGPSVVAVRDGQILDLSRRFATMRDLTESHDPAASINSADGPTRCSLEELLANDDFEGRDLERPWLLSPIDLQVVKAAGVTFPVSMIERVIEEQTGGDREAAGAIRAEFAEMLGGSLNSLRPGSPEAAALKRELIDRKWWSQYLEVGIGPDAEVFTKAPVLSTVGSGSRIGVLTTSVWNNPEPEVVLVVSSTGTVVGATLGNDVNLRDIEGRSALLLPKAKDNNASAAVGPFIRFFDDSFGPAHLTELEITLAISGTDGFRLRSTNPLSAISRTPDDLVRQVIGPHHQYPDGFVLYLGTLFTPVDDRDEPGRGFHHKVGDEVVIHEPRLGSLVNRVGQSEALPPWTFGIADLYRNLIDRGLIACSPSAEDGD